MAGFKVCFGSKRRWVAAAAAIGASCAMAQPTTPVANSPLDGPLFLQLLIGELEMSAGRAGEAYGWMLEAARRSGDDGLYQRVIEIALQGKAPAQALAAARAWRQAKPKSVEAIRFESQLLLALNRLDELAVPLSAWLAESSVVERPALIAAIPRLLQRASDRKQALALVERVLEPYRSDPGTRVPALVAIGRANFGAGNSAQALDLARQAQAIDPKAMGPALLALDMLPGAAEIERLVTDYLALPDTEPGVRLGYVRMLTQSQRYADASAQLETLTRERPQLAEPWLSLGALRLELKQPREAEAALMQFVELAGKAEPTLPSPAADNDDDDSPAATKDRNLTQAWLLLAQAAEQRGDLKAAETWLARIDNPQRALEVQSRKASILARQGNLKEARALIQAVPERQPDDARAKLLAEAQLLREAKRWREAADLLADANKRFKDDVDLIYEQAMAEEKVERFPEMERLLRRVIELKPAHPHAHNALGYSLADRNQRLPEARDLIRKALDLSPGDPFITDSLGWVEFRLGNRDEAARLLRQAYRARPDTEIAAHLGEVLWAIGERDEARRIWQDARGRDAANEVLRETLARLKVGL
ncbi:tetratricopeptide repeat protein [Aquabacterium sp.]|uniref:tetratricopeptide repeat protein n=1 Tax=Aquabacterium sp. TaxID=1872578 RepID=UPI002C4CC5B8|nr:tetratricopeptide repeat protein [Aquabacterium sp.]HSW06258.1 tetratricopeptide repeat protein [Aquabacterium sp.]